MHRFQISTFYEFTTFGFERLQRLRTELRGAMRTNSIRGTIILAHEGFNAAVCGEVDSVTRFLPIAAKLLETKLETKSSFHTDCPFRKIDVKIKPEIVTLKQTVDLTRGEGTHVDPENWNALISDPSVVVLDARNDYEFRNGTFTGAINPQTSKFSDLPQYITENLDPERNPKIAMFCTGGIRCEKFAPFLKARGFKEVYQLRGGILRYLERVPANESLWQGECFVFDGRITVDNDLEKGTGPDYSQLRERDIAE